MMDTARCTKAYLKVGAARKTLKEEYDVADSKLKAQQDVFGVELMRHLTDSNMDSSTNEFGKFSRKEDLKPSAENWPAIYSWIVENDGWELLHRRLGKTFVEKYAEDNEGALPNGVKVFREYVLHVAPARRLI